MHNIYYYYIWLSSGALPYFVSFEFCFFYSPFLSFSFSLSLSLFSLFLAISWHFGMCAWALFRFSIFLSAALVRLFFFRCVSNHLFWVSLTIQRIVIHVFVLCISNRTNFSKRKPNFDQKLFYMLQSWCLTYAAINGALLLFFCFKNMLNSANKHRNRNNAPSILRRRRCHCCEMRRRKQCLIRWKKCLSHDFIIFSPLSNLLTLVLYAFFIKPKSYYSIIIIVITIIIIMLAMVYTDNSRIERHWNGKWKYIMWELTWITCVLFSYYISLALYRCFNVFALPFEWHFIW